MTYTKTTTLSILLGLFLSLILNISFAQVFNDQFNSELFEKKDEFGSELDFHTWGDTTDNVKLSIKVITKDSEVAREGQDADNNVLAVERNIGSWGGFTNIFNDGENIVEKDLSAFSGINFWFYGTNENNEIFFELFDNRGDTTRDTAERFEFPFYNDFSGWEQITVPFEELKRRVDWQPGGEPNDGLTLDSSLGYAFRWGESSGTTYIDDITVYKSQSTDDGSLRASLSAANFEVIEGDSLELTLRLNREGEEASSLRYQFAVSDDEASARAYRDFVGRSELVVFPAGVTEKTIVISTLEDNLIEGPETYKITLAPTVGLKLGTNKSATITILDNDAEDAHLIDDFSKASDYITSDGLSATALEINDRMKQARPEQATFENMLELVWNGTGSFEKPIAQDWQFVEQIAFWYLGTGSEETVGLELSGSNAETLSFSDLAEWQYLEFPLEDLATIEALRFNLPTTETESKAYLDDIRIESRLSYKNPAYSAEERVADLLPQMSLEEKIGQMTQINNLRIMGTGVWDTGELNDSAVKNIFKDNQVGSILAGGGASPSENVPTAWAQLSNDIQAAAQEHSNLDIPIVYGIDAVHGHNNVQGATIYPHNIGLGATWNRELIQAINKSTADDLEILGHNWNFAPVADIARDARWGRFYESFGEDPLLVSELVVASVDGLQSSGKVAATVKHFTGYGQAFTGFDRSPSHIDMRSLRSIHLPSYQAAIDAGALSMMVNSGSVNGIPVHASYYMLETLAREEMGFEGVFISDWEDIHKLVSVHGVAKNLKEAVAMSINAGVDMYMVPTDADAYTSALKELVEEGIVSMERIDTAVSRILAMKMALGLFQNSSVDVDNANSLVEEDRSLAKQAALESITLLKNKSVLPLDSENNSIFLVGPSADNLANQMGGWTIGWQGMDNNGVTPPGATIREAIEASFADGKVSYTANYKNAEVVTNMASEADVSIVVVGEKPYAEGDGNDAQLELPEEQLELIRTLAKTDTSIVLVLVAGRPLMIPTDILHSVDGFVMTFLGGSEAGTALADVLSGAYNPSGKLSFSWPKHVGQIPVTYDRLKGSPYDPLYDFGYGLSYTNFRKRNLDVSASDSSIQFSVEVENTGEIAGSEVVQVYVKFPALGVIMSEQKLIAFDKVWLEPGESTTVSFNVPIERLAIIPQDILGMADAKVISGEYTIVIEKLNKRIAIP